MNTNEASAGVLYLCATPIGNLEDMTFRAVRMLGEVDLIAAEDTRHTRKLLTHYDIHTPLTSYHEHNKLEKGPELVAELLNGKSIACVSDAGLPGICDPGSHLAELCIAEGIQVSPLPGANAGLSALICSGQDTTEFSFIGFLPKTSRKAAELLERIRSYQGTLIFYEAPHHLKNTLSQLVKVLGPERQATACRELTKKFEEFRRSTLQELLDYYIVNEPRGEFVIILSGADEAGEVGNSEETAQSPEEMVASLEGQGYSRKEAMRETAKRLGMSRRDVYQLLLK